jgi:chloride channel protein, CIC family
MLAIVVASGVSKALSRDTIYTLKLRRRGIDLERHPGTELLRSMNVGAIMDTGLKPLPSDMAVTEGARRLLAEGHLALPVTDREGLLKGIVTVHSLSEVLSNDEDAERILLSDIAEIPATVLPAASLESVLDTLLDSSASAGTPVTDENGTFRGWLDQGALLRILSGASPTGPAKS